uniref:Basic helix-loop-helix transcription factor n=1 Tax=Salvia miltiorrhiza TaxID=226208 RepID=A0A0H3YBW0_SALMI|nr:basic helix-loop-helix transcription factor [Salvia miltiorrhiza]
MDHQNPSCSRADRKTIEKNRRNEMKALYTNLNSLIPPQPHSRPREMVSLPDQLEAATNYIKMQQAKLEKLKQKKNCLVWSKGGPNNLPNIDFRVSGSALEVVLITGLNCQFMFTRIIHLLHEEAAEVVAATFSVLDNTVFHTIHAKIGDQSAQNHGAARISERLKKFAYDCI